MGRKSALRRRAIEYLESCRGVHTEATVESYRWELDGIIRDAEALVLSPRIDQWGKAEIVKLRKLWEGRYAPKSLAKRFAILRCLLDFIGNPIIPTMRARNQLKLPKSERGEVRWHTREMREQLFAVAKGMDRMVLVLGYMLGLRRSEMIGLRLSDIGQLEVQVRGKGRKTRNTPLEPMVAREIARYRQGCRAEEVTRARKSGFQGTEPDILLVHAKGARLTGYTRWGPWARLKRLGYLADVEITTHDLRRTFGRTLHEAGVPLPVIQKALGHSQLSTTIEYLGIGQEDLRAAFQALTAEYGTIGGLASNPG